jgi:hypothetical protein
MAKVTKVTAADNSVSYNEEDTTFFDAVIMGVTGPLKALSNNKDVFYSEDVLGMACLASLAGGVALERTTELSRMIVA